MPLSRVERAVYKSLLPLVAQLDTLLALRLFLTRLSLPGHRDASQPSLPPYGEAALTSLLGRPAQADIQGGQLEPGHALAGAQSSSYYRPPAEPRSALAALRSSFRSGVPGVHDPASLSSRLDAGLALLHLLHERVDWARQAGVGEAGGGGGHYAGVRAADALLRAGRAEAKTGAGRTGTLPTPPSDGTAVLARTVRPGTLLLSHPFLSHPFHRSVVLILEHNDGGSVGVNLAPNPLEAVGTVRGHAQDFCPPLPRVRSKALPPHPQPPPLGAGPVGTGNGPAPTGNSRAASPSPSSSSWPSPVLVGGVDVFRSVRALYDGAGWVQEEEEEGAQQALATVHGLMAQLHPPRPGPSHRKRRTLTSRLSALSTSMPVGARRRLAFPLGEGDCLHLSYDEPPQWMMDAIAGSAGEGEGLPGPDVTPSSDSESAASDVERGAESEEGVVIDEDMRNAALQEWYSGAGAVAGLSEAEAFYWKARTRDMPVVMYRTPLHDSTGHRGAGGPPSPPSPSLDPAPVVARLGRLEVDARTLLEALRSLQESLGPGGTPTAPNRHGHARTSRAGGGEGDETDSVWMRPGVGGIGQGEGEEEDGEEEEEEEDEGQGSGLLAHGAHGVDQAELSADWGGHRSVQALLIDVEEGGRGASKSASVAAYKPLPLGPGLDMAAPLSTRIAQDAWTLHGWREGQGRVLPDMKLVRHGEAQGEGEGEGTWAAPTGKAPSSDRLEEEEEEDGEDEDEDDGDGFHTVDPASLLPWGAGLWRPGMPTGMGMQAVPLKEKEEEEGGGHRVRVRGSGWARPRPLTRVGSNGYFGVDSDKGERAGARPGDEVEGECGRWRDTSLLSWPARAALSHCDRMLLLRPRGVGVVRTRYPEGEGAVRTRARHRAVLDMRGAGGSGSPSPRPVTMHVLQRDGTRWAVFSTPLPPQGGGARAHACARGCEHEQGEGGGMFLTVPLDQARGKGRRIAVHLLGPARLLPPPQAQAAVRVALRQWAGDVQATLGAGGGGGPAPPPPPSMEGPGGGGGRHSPPPPPTAADPVTVFGSRPVWRGGPVGGYRLVLHPHAPASRYEVGFPSWGEEGHPPSVHVTRDVRAAAKLVALGLAKAEDFVFYSGAAKWGRGQLARELTEGAWIAVDHAHVAQLLKDGCGCGSSPPSPSHSGPSMWSTVLASVGGEHGAWARQVGEGPVSARRGMLDFAPDPRRTLW